MNNILHPSNFTVQNRWDANVFWNIDASLMDIDAEKQHYWD